MSMTVKLVDIYSYDLSLFFFKYLANLGCLIYLILKYNTLKLLTISLDKL